MLDFDNIICDCFSKTIEEGLPCNIHERTFVSRMAHHLADIIENDNIIEKECSKIKVDVEYNRNVNDSKRINKKLRFVDLIIHERKTNNNNISAIEFKNKKDSNLDKNNLINLKNCLGYKYIYFIIITKRIIYKYNENTKNWEIIFNHQFNNINVSDENINSMLKLNSDKYE